MGATLTQRRRVGDDVLRDVKPFCWGGDRTVPSEEAPANYVPAAAVIRRGRALSGFTGRKARVGGLLGPTVKGRGSTPGWRGKPAGWREAEEGGMAGGAVKCVEISRNTQGEGSLLGLI